jgi:hypothetical protein
VVLPLERRAMWWGVPLTRGELHEPPTPKAAISNEMQRMRWGGETANLWPS